MSGSASTECAVPLTLRENFWLIARGPPVRGGWKLDRRGPQFPRGSGVSSALALTQANAGTGRLGTGPIGNFAVVARRNAWRAAPSIADGDDDSVRIGAGRGRALRRHPAVDG